MISFVTEHKKVTDIFLVNLPVGSTFMAEIYGYEHLIFASKYAFYSLSNPEYCWGRSDFDPKWFTKLVDIEVKIND